MLAGYWASPGGAIPADYLAHSESPIVVGDRFAVVSAQAPGYELSRTNRGGLHAFCLGRVAEQAELRSLVRLSREASTAETLGRGYQRAGAPFLARVRGDWALAAWDARTGSGFLGRDALGIVPLYCATFAWGGAFATDIEWLLGLPGVDRAIDWDRLACMLASIEPEPSATFFSKVRALPAAHVMEIGTHRVQLLKYWALTVPEELQLDTDRDYVERYESVFRTAVKRSLDPGAGVLLSGGLDSSSIFGFAHSLGYSPTAVSATVRELPSCDETRYIRPTVARFGLPAIETDVSDPASCPSPSEVAPYADDPQRLVWYPIAWQACAAAARGGLDCLVTGAFGDYVGGGAPNALLELLARRELSSLAKAFRRHPRSTVRKLISQTVLWASPRVHDSFIRLAGSNMDAVEFVHRDFCRDHRLRERQMDLTRPALSSRENLVNALQSDWIESEAGNFRWNAKHNGLAVRFPFLDVDLLSLVVALPLGIRWRHQRSRWVLRRVAKPHVVPAVLTRRRKTGFSELFSRYRRQWVESISRTSYPESVFDVGKIFRAVERPSNTRIEWYKLWTCGAVAQWLGQTS